MERHAIEQARREREAAGVASPQAADPNDEKEPENSVTPPPAGVVDVNGVSQITLAIREKWLRGPACEFIFGPIPKKTIGRTFRPFHHPLKRSCRPACLGTSGRLWLKCRTAQQGEQ